MELITDTQTLAEACTLLASETYITVDTEFIRDSTYWPKLCLVQVAGHDAEYLIDPLATEIDLAPFYSLMADEAVIKVFHAARQDIEIFYHFGNVIPSPLIDTQVAAMVCGFGDSVGYEALIRKTLNQQVDKSSRFTDWARRPLSKQQINYALSDVTFLRPAYEVLEKQIFKSDRRSWMDEEIAVLTAPETYMLHPEDSWQRLKVRNLNAKSLAVLIEIAAWRERQAQSRDLPRQRVFKDDVLYELARQCPKDIDTLETLRGVPKGFSRSKSAQSLIEAIAQGLDRPRNTLPKIEKPNNNAQRTGPIVELLKVLLKKRCEEFEVAQKLIAGISDLEQIAVDDNANVPALKGWRRELFGADAIALKHGRLALSVDTDSAPPSVIVIPLGS